MALRLPAPHERLAAARPPPLAALAARLPARDLDGYAALFAEAAAIADVASRATARARSPLEARCARGHAEAAARCRRSTSPRAARLGSLLEEEPREPVLLNYVGVLLYELWSLDAGRALFAAARRLDPELPNVGAT